MRTAILLALAIALAAAVRDCSAGEARNVKSCKGGCPECDCIDSDLTCCCPVSPGYFAHGRKRYQCPGGTYTSARRACACTPCPAGWTYNIKVTGARTARECALARCAPETTTYAIPSYDADAVYEAATVATAARNTTPDSDVPFSLHARLISEADAVTYATAFTNFPILSRKLLDPEYEGLAREPSELCMEAVDVVAAMTAPAPNTTFCAVFNVDEPGCKFCTDGATQLSAGLAAVLVAVWAS